MEDIVQRVLRILIDEPLSLDWRVHGIGFIKAYVTPDKSTRLNIYNKKFITPGITIHHDHPWHLTSRILAGELTNTRFKRMKTTLDIEASDEYEIFNEGVINCANFRGVEDRPRLAYLASCKPEVYGPGKTYMQFADEIHKTEAVDGTVTLMRRTTALNGNGTARVFWPIGTQYVNADIPDFKKEDAEEAIAKAVELLREEYLL